MTSLHSLGITIPQSCSLSHQVRFPQLPDLIWRIRLKIRPQFKKKVHYIDVFPQNFPCKYLTAGRGQKTQSKIKNILHTTYSNILTTFDHYWKTFAQKNIFSIHPNIYATCIHSSIHT